MKGKKEDVAASPSLSECKYCKSKVSLPKGRVYNYLCKKCIPLYAEYLRELEKITPFLKDGTVAGPGKGCSSVKSADSSKILSLYQKVNVPGKSVSTLGKGAYGEVWLVQHKETKQLHALKLIDKRKLGASKMQATSALKVLEREIDIQKRLAHENIIRLHDYVQDDDTMYIVMEYASKGTLFQLIRAKTYLSEREAFYMFIQVCSAVNFLHRNNLVHRDIKPENLLITEKGILKLCDFGCCAPYTEEEGRKTFCGTVEYMAPEILRREKYDSKADVWSLGVLLFEMLHGHAPFRGYREQDTMKKILENSIVFDEAVKEDAQDLITIILNDDPKMRPNVIEVMFHPWIKRLQADFKIPNRSPKKKGNAGSGQDKRSSSAERKSEETKDSPSAAEAPKRRTELEPSRKGRGDEDCKEKLVYNEIFKDIPRGVLYGFPSYEATLSKLKEGRKTAGGKAGPPTLKMMPTSERPAAKKKDNAFPFGAKNYDL